MKRFYQLVVFVVTMLVASMIVHAKVSESIKEAMVSNYPPAVENNSLLTAHDAFDSEALRGFVVLKKGGIPVERARYFVQWQEYDYRGVVIHLDKNDKMTTRRGKPYAYLQRGDVLAVAGIEYLGRTIYLKLITPEVYVPESRSSDKHHSRVTVMLGFKFSKDIINSGDANAVLATLKQWFEPFKNLHEAKVFGVGLGLMKAERIMELEETVKVKQETEAKANSKSAPVAKVSDDRQIENQAKMEVLEDKIEAAKKQMEEAEAQMKKLKKEMKDK